MLDTGLSFQLPEGKVGIIKARSSMAKAGLAIDGEVIDSDFRGSVILLIRNQSKYHSIKINAGDCIAQMLILDCPQYKFFKTH